MSAGIDWSNLDVTQLDVTQVPEPTAGVASNEAPYYGPPGTKANCPDCGRELTILQSGRFREHKCFRDIQTRQGSDHPPGSTPADTPRRRKGRAPENVQKLWVAALSTSAEWSATKVLAKNTGADPATIPTSIPDDHVDDMCRPILDAIWPRLPKGVQKGIVAVADEAGLIVAAMMWTQYIKALNAWQRDYKMANRTRPATVPTMNGGSPHGFSRPAEQQTDSAFSAFTPFIADAG